jgi:hypothetical protein
VAPVIREHQDTAHKKSLGPIKAGSGHLGLATALHLGNSHAQVDAGRRDLYSGPGSPLPSASPGKLSRRVAVVLIGTDALVAMNHLRCDELRGLDPALAYISVHGDKAASEVFDSLSGLRGPPDTKVLKGRESQFEVGSAVADPKDVMMEVALHRDVV